MWESDHKEGWEPKNWCFWTVVLEKTLESPLDCKEIKQVNHKGNQSWIFTGRTDAEAEAPVFWPHDIKSWFTGKDPDAGKDWRQEEKGMTEDEMVGWHHWLNGHESEQAPGVGDGQGRLVCCSPWGRKESDMTEKLNWTELNLKMISSVSLATFPMVSSHVWLTYRFYTIPIIAERSLGQRACRGRAEGGWGKLAILGRGKNKCVALIWNSTRWLKNLKGGWCRWSIEAGRESGMRWWGQGEKSGHIGPPSTSKREHVISIRRRMEWGNILFKKGHSGHSEENKWERWQE